MILGWLARESLELMHVRAVPTCPAVLGAGAREAEPDIKQIFVTGVTEEQAPRLDCILYRIRKRIENRIADEAFLVSGRRHYFLFLYTKFCERIAYFRPSRGSIPKNAVFCDTDYQ